MYKLTSKAISHKWNLLRILKIWRFSNAPCFRRLKVSTALLLFVIETVLAGRSGLLSKNRLICRMQDESLQSD